MIKTIHFIFDTLINHTVAILHQIIHISRQKGIIFLKLSENFRQKTSQKTPFFEKFRARAKN